MPVEHTIPVGLWERLNFSSQNLDKKYDLHAFAVASPKALTWFLAHGMKHSERHQLRYVSHILRLSDEIMLFASNTMYSTILSSPEPSLI